MSSFFFNSVFNFLCEILCNLKQKKHWQTTKWHSSIPLLSVSFHAYLLLWQLINKYYRVPYFHKNSFIWSTDFANNFHVLRNCILKKKKLKLANLLSVWNLSASIIISQLLIRFMWATFLSCSTWESIYESL